MGCPLAADPPPPPPPTPPPLLIWLRATRPAALLRLRLLPAQDTITLAFDVRTDRGASNASQDEAGMALVDRLFFFSTPLGSNYSGAWLDDSTYQVEVLAHPEDGADVPTVGISEASLTTQSNIRNRASTTPPDIGVPVELTGDFGASAPRLESFTAQAASGVTAYGVGTGFQILMDKFTDRGGVRGGKLYVDSLFDFSHSIGTDYSGLWLDSSTFEVVVVSTGGERIPLDGAMRVAMAGSITNPARTSLPVSGGLRVRTDAAQSYFAPPRIVEALAIDLTNNDTVLSQNDQIKIVFGALWLACPLTVSSYVPLDAPQPSARSLRPPVPRPRLNAPCARLALCRSRDQWLCRPG